MRLLTVFGVADHKPVARISKFQDGGPVLRMRSWKIGPKWDSCADAYSWGIVGVFQVILRMRRVGPTSRNLEILTRDS